jgi:hypothetical protein
MNKSATEALTGNLKGFAVETIAHVLSISTKTGCLEIKGLQYEGKIYFREGKIYFAYCDSNRKKIGEFLVESGLITSKQLQEAIEIQKRSPLSNKRLGEILAEIKQKQREPIDDAIDKFVKDQILNSISEMIQIEEGEFKFIPNETAVDEDICVYLDPKQLLTEMKQQLDEWQEIRKYIHSSRAIITLNAEPQTLSPPLNALLVGADQWKALVEIANSNEEVTPSNLRDRLKLNTISCYKLLISMVKLGLIEIKKKGTMLKTDQLPAQVAAFSKKA